MNLPSGLVNARSFMIVRRSVPFSNPPGYAGHAIQETSVLFLLGSSRWSGIAPLDVTREPVLSSGALPEARRGETQGDPGDALGRFPRLVGAWSLLERIEASE